MPTFDMTQTGDAAHEIARVYRDFAASLRKVRELARGEDLPGLTQECKRLSHLATELGDLPPRPSPGDHDERVINCLVLETRCELVATLEFLGALSNHTRSLLGVLGGAGSATYDARSLRRDRCEGVAAP